MTKQKIQIINHAGEPAQQNNIMASSKLKKAYIQGIIKDSPTPMRLIYLRSKSGSAQWTGHESNIGEYILARNGKSIAMGLDNILSYLERSN